MLRLTRQLAWLSTRGPWQRFVRACQAPEVAHETAWRVTEAALAGAPHWRGRALREQPVTDYASYQPVLARDFAARVSSLSGDPITFWAQSAGSTAQPKLFPLTARYQRQFQQTNGPFIHGLLRRFDGLLRQPVLYFAGLDPTQHSPAGIAVGFISNFNYRRVPALLRSAYAFPPHVLTSEAAFDEWAPAHALATDLSALFAIAPSRVTLFLERILRDRDAHFKRLLTLKPSRARLRQVEAGLAAGTLGALWPSLAVVCCWKSSVCGLQVDQLLPHTGGVPVVDAIYSATEGWVSVPLQTASNGGPLHPGGVICEFFPVGASPDRLLKPWELTVGHDYEIVMTNLMGLVRYRLFDVVRCTGFFHRSPVIEFVQKVGADVLFGLALVSEQQLAAAVKGIAQRFLFAPSEAGDGAILHLERLEPGLAERVDAALQAANEFYRHEREIGALKPLQTRVSPLERIEHAQSKPRVFSRTHLSMA